jgi:uroporphyrinogen-III synthase
VSNPNSLNTLKVLITRPAHQAQLLCDSIRAESGIPILFPTIEIADPEDKSSLLNAIQQLANFDIAIFTSANAVLKTLPYWPKKPPKISIAAIGPATAKVLERFSLRANFLPKNSFTSEDLLRLPELHQLKKKHVVIFTGEKGREFLAEALRKHGAEVFEAMAYRRLMPENFSPLFKNQIETIDIVVITSGEGLKNLVSMVGDKKLWLLERPLLVVSQRLQTIAEQLGFMTIIKAENATDKAILEGLKAWYASSFLKGYGN